MSRHYLMCRPTYFAVDYAINPWMDPTAPVDADLAVSQWEALVETYRSLGHTVEFIDPIPGLPDMVFAANGATMVDGTVLGVSFTFAERAAEGPAYLDWFDRAGYRTQQPKATNEGEGDMLLTSDYLLAGTGFRTDLAAHAEAQELFGLPVITLQLVDPRFYHLDTALCVIDPFTAAYYPGAFDEDGLLKLKTLFPELVEATEEDALAFGLNAVSDGRHVVIPHDAVRLREVLTERGYDVIPVEMTELRKAGGGPKCCTLELRP
jgi:N-dimethylarginine dimethylaminohydrolase